MRKRLIPALAITGVILVVLAVWFGVRHLHSQPKKATPAKLTTAQKEAPHDKLFGNKDVVLINESTFGPGEITVKAGTTIVWTNMEAATHQIVTDDNTTILAAKSPVLAQGQSYSFVFNKAGTFRYHCNLHPAMQGTITVE